MTSRQLIWTAIILLLLILAGLGYYVALSTGLLGERYVAGQQDSSSTVQQQAGAQDTADKDQSRIPPTLDIVRVEPTGETVVAGRAAPGATVRLEKEGEIIGEAVANAVGEWVIVPGEPLGAGSSAVELFAVMPDGTQVPSEESIVIEVGEGGETQPLVIVTRGNAPSEVMQAPQVTADAAPAEEAPAPAGDAAATVADSAQDEAPAGEAGETVVAQAPAANEHAPASQPDAGASPEADAAAPVEADADRPDAGQQEAAAPVGDSQVAGQAGAQQETDAAPSAAAEAETGGEAKAPPAVQVETVESDSEGRIFASGVAQPGSSVQVYLDNQTIGTAETDNEGRWEIAAAKPLAPGDYDVRVDQIGASGAVEARSQVVFNQAEPVAAAAASELPASAPDSVQLQKLEIRRGDNLWRISRRLYGRGIRYTVIYDANRNVITDPDLIFPGQVFVIPPDALPQQN